MVRSQSTTPSAGVLTLVLLLASSLLVLAKPEDVLTADITEGKVRRLSPQVFGLKTQQQKTFTDGGKKIWNLRAAITPTVLFCAEKVRCRQITDRPFDNPQA